VSCLRTALPALGQWPWHAIHTRCNSEKVVAAVLRNKGYEQYLPTYRVQRRWSVRTVQRVLPLFAGYLFCRFDRNRRVPVLATPGVVSIVGFGDEPATVSDAEITALQTVLQSGFPVQPCPFINEGQRVRVTHGALQGVEGILARKKSDCRMVISVAMLKRSVSVEVDAASITLA
jgi:transcription antitermination factor NusG